MNYRPLSLYRVLFLLVVATGTALQPSFGATVPHYLITGTVVDPSNAPIASVGVTASAMINGTNHVTSPVNTDSSGHYSLSVSTPAVWTVALDNSTDSSDTHSLANIGYNAPDPKNVTISNQDGVVNFIVPNFGDVELSGYLTDTNNNPIAGVNVTASLPSHPSAYGVTDANGFYELILDSNGYWSMSLDCSNLTALGFQCVADQTNIGVGFQNVRLTTIVAQTNGAVAAKDFFGGEASLGSNWYYLNAPTGHSQAFGYYNKASFPYINHLDLGWEYYIDAGDAAHGAYFYDFTSGAFFYTSPSLFPYLYDFKRNAWMYYLPQSGDRYSSNPRWFFDLTAQAWFNDL